MLSFHTPCLPLKWRMGQEGVAGREKRGWESTAFVTAVPQSTFYQMPLRTQMCITGHLSCFCFCLFLETKPPVFLKLCLCYSYCSLSVHLFINSSVHPYLTRPLTSAVHSCSPLCLFFPISTSSTMCLRWLANRPCVLVVIQLRSRIVLICPVSCHWNRRRLQFTHF